MRFLALIYGNDDIWGSAPPERWREIVRDVDAFNARLRESGELVAVDGLAPRPRAVRAPDGVPVVSDGPYLEAKEHVGSYFIVDVDSEERALEIVRSYPVLRLARGGVELWPLMEHGTEG
ncbi:MAG TPA: YciI family protein [Capillimicrobium sp.]